MPLTLPRQVRFGEVARVDLDLASEAWQLRCLSVDAAPGDSIEVDGLDERWRDRLTPVGAVFYDDTLPTERSAAN